MNKALYKWQGLGFGLVMIFGLTGCNTAELMTKKIEVGSTAAEYVPDKLEQIKQQELAIQEEMSQADSDFNNGDLDSAELHYKNVLALDTSNSRAQESIRRIGIFRQHEKTIAQAKSLMGKSDEGEQQAARLLQGVLVEDPSNESAAILYKSILDKENAKRIEAMRIKLAYKEHISLEFRNTDFKIIIEALAKGTGVNFMLDKDVRNNIKASLFVHDVTLEDALDMLVQSNQLKKKVLSDNSVIIYPDTTLKVRQYEDLVIRSFYLEYADPKTVSNLLKTMLGIKQVQVDDRLPMIMIKDVPEVMGLAEKLIRSQDIADPEVMLEMEILEVRRSAGSENGVTWPTQLTVLSSGEALTLDALKRVGSSEIGVSPNPAINFGGQDSDINLLANPRIRVKNKQAAKIHIGDRVPIVTSNVSSNGVISDNVQYIDTGLKLDVSPDISMAGDVTIQLTLDVSRIVGQPAAGVAPQIGTRSTTTQLRLRDGETQVLAGLISDEDRKTITKVPGLGDIPGLGRLFSSHTNDKVKTELVLSITPRIIRVRKSPEAELANYWMGTELRIGRGMTGARGKSREEISKLFKAGVAPGTPKEPEVAAPEENYGPDSLNIGLPPGLISEF
mgnify:CR=1 FL=1